jgi:hypothetical protein
MCQRCHLRLDRAIHSLHRNATLRRKKKTSLTLATKSGTLHRTGPEQTGPALPEKKP